MYPSIICRMSASEKKLYLTFDDGPLPTVTPHVLSILKQYNAKATFFCVGDNVSKHPQEYAQLLNEGHAVGNHTMHHIKGWKTGTNTFLDNVEQCRKVIESHLFRPPYGRIKGKQINALKDKYTIIMWSLLSLDFEKNLNIKKALANLKRKTKAGSIIVFHDSIKAEKNLKEILPQYLQFINAQGFNCKVL